MPRTERGTETGVGKRVRTSYDSRGTIHRLGNEGKLGHGPHMNVNRSIEDDRRRSRGSTESMRSNQKEIGDGVVP